MATKKAASKAVASKTPASKNKGIALAGNKSIAELEQEMASEVGSIRDQISAPSGNKLKLEVKGTFTTPDGLDLGNEIKIVPIDFVTRNFFYSKPYVPGQTDPPDCYALGRIKHDLVPEADSPMLQNKAGCPTCPMNAFQSAPNGKGKACQNRYWVACLLVDDDNPDAHNDPGAPIYILDLSPSNNRSFEGAVAHVARALNGLPVKAIFTVTAANEGTWASVTFSDPVPNPDWAAHFSRRPEVQDALFRKPDFAAYEAKAAASRKGPARRPAATRR